MYEIPQQLQYKERIIFNLTFEQLLYAFIFLIPALILLRSNLSLTAKVMISIFPILLAVGFMFFDLMKHLKMWYTWFRLRKTEQEKINTFFGVKGVYNDLIHTSSKELAVLKVEPINFKIKPSDEKEIITLSFQKLLNSLNFPIQILMTTENLSLNKYFNRVKENIKKSFEKFFEDYKNNLKNIIKDNSLSNRSFYIVIPKVSDINNQLEIIEELLHSMNLKTIRLSDSSLKKIIPIILNESKDNAPIPVENNPDHVKINNKLVRTIYAYGYPRSVESGFLDKIISSEGDFNLSLHIEPHSIENTFVSLNRELQKQRADLYSAKLKNQLNSSLEIQYSDTLKTLEHLQKGDEKLFNISLYITCKADKKEKLDLLTQKVESELNALMIIPRRANFQMLQGLKSCLPLLENSLNAKRNVTTKALSAFFPFTSQFLEADEGGVWLGLNKNNIPIIKDIFNLSNPNGTVLAQSGGGKSYFCKLLISRYLLNNTKVMVIDPQGEYSSLVRHFEGQRIDLSKDSKTIINPLDLMGHSYLEKRLSLIDLMKVMLGGISDVQKALLDKALNKTYAKKGITKNPDTWSNKPPILGDLMKVLKQMEKDSSKLEQSTINSLSSRLEMYVNGAFSFFNRKTNINFDNDFVCFDIGNMPAQVKPTVMFLVLDYIYMKMKSNLDRKILLIDEAWSLLSRAEDASYIFEIVKTCRKFNLGLLLINQEVEGLLESKAGKSVLANSAYTFLMRQRPAVIDGICKTFHLSERERNHLLTAPIGEGLLLMEDDHSEMKVIASDEEDTLITTNPDELNGTKKVQKDEVNEESRDVNITVNVNKRYFRKSQLGRDDIKYLLDEGYEEKKFKCLLSNKKETFLIQPRHNESDTHLFMTKNISEYLESNGIETELYTTKKPDIVFEIDGERYAIEIETGAVLSKVSRMKEKVKQLNDDYDEWFFVVTNRNKVKTYKKFGKTIDVRYIRTSLNRLIKQANNAQN